MSKIQKPSKVATRLKLSLEQAVPVAIHRHMDPDDHLEAVVLEISDGWILLTRLRDGAYLNGNTLIRARDISRVKREETFLPVLRARGAWPPESPAKGLDLSSPKAFLPQIAGITPILTFHEELRRLDKLWIGSIAEWKRKSMWFHCIDPDGRWSQLLIKVKFRHLTRIDIFEDYADAVAEAAGPRNMPDTAEYSPMLAPSFETTKPYGILRSV